jgi:hypothetical protein
MERALGEEKSSGVMIIVPGPRFLRLSDPQKLLNTLIENGNLRVLKPSSP